MAINKIGFGRPIPPTLDNTKTKDRQPGSSETKDKVELSERASTLEKLKAKAKATPAVRQEKIDAIKQAIENKTYKVKSEDVARSLLKNHIMDEILKP